MTDYAPDPPVGLPPGRLVHVPGRGEFFVRDSETDGPPILLLHGWMFQSDLNWWRAYRPLIDGGYRVLAVDHRGHGRGLRSTAPFRLADCASDAAALVRELGCAPLPVVGYSMGGAVAQLMARDHPDAVAALVACATAPDWTEPHMRRLWKSMGALRLLLAVFPTGTWRGLLNWAGFEDSPTTTWIASELSRGSSLDLAEAGRELGRYDARPWLPGLDVASAVVVTTRDRSVPPRKQRELAGLLRAQVFEHEGDHDSVVAQGEQFASVLLEALAAVREPHARAA